MEIREEHMEWAIVHRLRTMPDRSSQDEFDVTRAFALFSAICLWVRQRVGDGAFDLERPGLGDLRKPVTNPTWGLADKAVHGSDEVHPGGGRVRIELSECTAWQFFV